MNRFLARVFSRKIMSDSTHWSQRLKKDLCNPELIVAKSNSAVAIRDKFPKAKYHFLILPQEDIDDIFQLRKCHLPLLMEMEELGKNAVEISGGKFSDFKMGYHAQPSMKRLHLHVISDDFISRCMKTQKHWNGYNTDYFIPAHEFRRVIEERGQIEELPNTEIQAMLSKPLQCHKCSYRTNNMGNLKNHLLFHVKRF